MISRYCDVKESSKEDCCCCLVARSCHPARKTPTAVANEDAPFRYSSQGTARDMQCGGRPPSGSQGKTSSRFGTAVIQSSTLRYITGFLLPGRKHRATDPPQ